MTIPFDPTTGRASGTPRRVTLERAFRGFRLSPDGRWIAYTAGNVGSMVMKVISSNGGTPRAVTEPYLRLFVQDWSADSRFLYYMATFTERPNDRPMMRVPVEGGPPERVMEKPTGPSAPASRHRIWIAEDAAETGLPYVAESYDGEAVARVVLPSRARAMAWTPSFTPDGRHVLSVVANTAEPLRILPVAGGAPRQLGEARGYEIPVGWSSDSKEVLFETTLDGRRGIMSVPVEGGAAREILPAPDRGLPSRNLWENPIDISADGRYWAYSRPTPGSMDRTLVIRSMDDGEEREITRSLFYHQSFRLAGPGGSPNVAGDEFLYLERKGDQVELRATPPTGPSRLLRVFSAPDRRMGKSVYGDWVAWEAWDQGPAGEDQAPVAQILLSKGPGEAPKELAAIEGLTAIEELAWSHDGRWIAATTYVDNESGDGSDIKVLLIGVGPDGEVAEPPRLIDTPMVGSAWGIRWLPDGSAVVLYGQTLPDWAFDVWLIPLKNGARPVQLSRDETDGIGINILSPDGRYIAYQAFVQRGSSLWLADLGDALEEVGR
jgi:Tol biopolymer transport system component